MVTSRGASGLFITSALTSRNVSVDMHFEPSVGILARKVDKLGADIRSFREPLKRMIKEVMIPSIRQNFDSGGRPGWTPLAEMTLKNKARKGQSSSPLIATGRLRRTMGQVGIWHIDTEKAMILDLPNDVWYGKVHQAGLNSISRTVTVKNIQTGATETFQEAGDSDNSIPARPFVTVQNEDIDKMERIMSEWVGERIRRAGL